MKRYGIIAIVFVLTAAMLSGCRGRNDNMDNTSEPTVMPTVEMPTSAPTEATAAPTTEATSLPTEPTVESETETVGEDGFVDTNPTESDAARNRSRKIPGMR